MLGPLVELAATAASRHAPVAPWEYQLVLLGFSWAVIIGAVWDGLKWIAGKAADAAVAIAIAVKKAAVFAWHGLRWLGLKTKDAAWWIADKAKDLWHWIVKSGWPALVRALKAIQGWLKSVFGPLYQFVKRTQHALLWFYDHILRPILGTLEVMRLISKALADLGVDWAKKADDYLARLEQRLWTAFVAILQKVNFIADIFDLIFDPSGTLKKALVLWSAFRWFPHVQALVLWVMSPHNPWPEANALRGSFGRGSYSDQLAGMRATATGFDPTANAAFQGDFQRLVRGQETG